MITAEIPDACAACGKVGDGLKKCTSCQQVKYCGRECQASDWMHHKQACKKKAAELHDEALFKQPPTRDDCPICFLMLPANAGEKHYQPCCGQRRVEANDAFAIFTLGVCHSTGKFGVAKDSAMARKLWERAGKLGNPEANSILASMYNEGHGVKRDPKKAKHYYELAAMGGDVCARYKLGFLELEPDKKLRRVLTPPQERAVKHFVIAAKDGHELSMKNVTAMRELIGKQEYEEVLRAFVKVTKEMRGEQRDKANEDKSQWMKAKRTR